AWDARQAERPGRILTPASRRPYYLVAIAIRRAGGRRGKRRIPSLRRIARWRLAKSAYRFPKLTARPSASNRLRPPDRFPDAATCGRPCAGSSVLIACLGQPSPPVGAGGMLASPAALRAGRGLD